MSSPHDQPVTFVTGSEGAGQPSFTGPGYRWTPSDSPESPADPHDVSYTDIGEEIEPVDGEIPPNIVGGSCGHYPPGPISRTQPIIFGNP
jgi:hypothetical protein